MAILSSSPHNLTTFRFRHWLPSAPAPPPEASSDFSSSAFSPSHSQAVVCSHRDLLFGLWRVCFPPCLVRPGRRLPVQGLSEGSLGYSTHSPPGGGHAPRGAPSTRGARSLGRTHRPRLPGVRRPRATSCQRPPCVSRAAHHRAKRRAMLGPCAQRQRYAKACCAYRPTFIRCLSINPPPPSS